MTSTTTVTTKYQVVIPKDVRIAAHIVRGDQVSMITVGDCIVMQKNTHRGGWADSLLGLGKDVWKNVDPVTYVRKERRGWNKKRRA